MIFTPAHAKLNLALSVVGRRPDGRHDLRSVVVRLDWHDLVGLEWAAGGSGAVSLIVSGPMAAEAPPGPDNLAARAAGLGSGPSGTSPRVHLEKRLPAAAGLGGGSADAAAVLRLLAEAGALTRSMSELIRLADALGSDVPACLVGGGLLVGGAGERLEPIEHPTLHLAVAVAGRSSTGQTFSALSPGEWHGPERPEELARRLSAGASPAPELLGSDLEAAACRANPALGAELRRLRALRGPPWHLTGSGGACFALAHDAGEAARLAASAAALGLPARACRTVAAR